MDAFEQFYQQHRQRIYRFALRKLASRERAEEATQDVLMVAYRKSAELGPEPARLERYVQVAMRSLCLDYIKQKRRHDDRLISLDQALQQEQQGGKRILPHQQVTPEMEVQQRELRAAVQQGLSTLPSGVRSVVELKIYEELEEREIADYLGLSLWQVRRFFQKGKKELARQLPPQPDERNAVASKSKFLSSLPKNNFPGLAYTLLQGPHCSLEEYESLLNFPKTGSERCASLADFYHWSRTAGKGKGDTLAVQEWVATATQITYSSKRFDPATIISPAANGLRQQHTYVPLYQSTPLSTVMNTARGPRFLRSLFQAKDPLEKLVATLENIWQLDRKDILITTEDKYSDGLVRECTAGWYVQPWAVHLLLNTTGVMKGVPFQFYSAQQKRSEVFPLPEGGKWEGLYFP